MPTAKDFQAIRKKLLDLLEPALPGIEVDVGLSDRWKRMCLTFRHKSFGGLFLEQRFRMIMQRLPEDYYEQKLRGAVWFELAPGETIEDALGAPRSGDVEKAEPKLARKLLKLGFFSAMQDAAGESPIETCSGDFMIARKVLSGLGVVDDEQRDACLVFIRQGAYCDCEVLLTAQEALTTAYGKK